MDILLEFTPMAQYAIGMDHNITCWNKSCELLTGFSEKEMIGSDNQWMAFYDHKRPVLADLIVDGKYDEITNYYKDKSKKSAVVPDAWEATDFFPLCGGKPRHLYWWAAPIFHEQRMIGVVTTLQDVTEQKYWELLIEKQSSRLSQENISLKTSIREKFQFGNIIGNSQSMQNVYHAIIKSANSEANVVIYGESGTGKEQVARAIHDMRSRANNEFVPVNCGAIPEPIMESEFFGHMKGAFTGASTDKKGYLDLANMGTLFLDEVGELTLPLQVKLLRALESGEYTPVGCNRARKSNFHLISATNKDLSGLLKKGLIREDFFYRVHVIPIYIPPLRDRKEDLPFLIDHFMKKYGDKTNPTPLPGNVIEALYKYDWPGNIRELQNVIQRYLTLGSCDFIQNLKPQRISELQFVDDSEYDGQDLKAVVKAFERKYIAVTLEKKRWKKTLAAKSLYISRRTLFRKMLEYGLV